MSTNPQPLSIIADVSVVVASPAVNGPPFNQGMFIDTSTAIPSYGVNPRARRYLAGNWSASMIADGFTVNDPAYLCMQLYFSQSPQPQAGWAGRQDLTAIQTAIPHAGDAGLGYVVGDLVGVTQAGASFGVLRVSTIGAGGAVTALTTIVGQQGTGYAVAAGLATTGGTGAGLQVDITAIGETPLQAAQACRISSAAWYCFMFGSAIENADVESVAAWVLPTLGTYFLHTTQDANSLNGITPNLLTTLFGASNKRTWVQWASTQGGLYPNQIYFTAAVMGRAMAANTQLAGSAFSMKFSAGAPLVGVYTEPLSTTQISNIEGPDTNTGPNANLFINYANSFSVLEQGTSMAQGQFFDEILNLDIIASNIQYNILNVLASLPKVPQTEPGQVQLEQAVEQALATAALTGFIGPGVWEGQTVLGVTPGTPMPLGYIVQSQPYTQQAASDRQLRKAMPIYVTLIEAGAVHFVTVLVLVQR
jgi:hypothetical protein